jgi:hypothetical protein
VTRAELAKLRESNLAIVLNMEDSALKRYYKGGESIPAVIAQCSFDSDIDLLSIKTISGRVSSFYPNVLKEFSKKPHL